MKKHPVFFCLAFSFILLCSGVSIAYYNTKTFGFDENASVITVKDDSVQVLDYTIKYSDVEKAYDKIIQYIPDKSVIIVSGGIQRYVSAVHCYIG